MSKERVPNHDHSGFNQGGKLALSRITEAGAEGSGGSSGGGGSTGVIVEEDGAVVVAAASAVNAGHGLDATDGGGGIAGLAVDESELDHALLGNVLADQHHAKLHAAAHAKAGTDEVEVEDLATDETDTTKRLAPDGTGGVAWGTGGSGGAPDAAEDGSVVQAAATEFDFRHGLDVTAPGGSVARIAVDETELSHASLANLTTGDPHTQYALDSDVAAGYQPLDSDLTAIAALSTTSFGRALLTLADAAAGRTSFGVVIGTDVEAHDADLTTIAGLSPSNDDVLQRKAGAWANRTIAQLLVDLAAAGTTFQPLDSDLTSIAALATTAFGRALLTLASPSDATQFLNGAATAAYAQVKDSDLATTDITTNDATSSKHGFLPKLAGGSTKFLREDGTWQLVSAASVTVFRGCKLFNSTTQSVTGGATAAAHMNSEIFDTDAFHFTSTANLTGTVAKNGTTAIVGTSTLFTTELTVNQVISIPGTATEIGVVASITDNTHLTLTQAMVNTASGQTATRRDDYVAIPAGLNGYYTLFASGDASTSTWYMYFQINGSERYGRATVTSNGTGEAFSIVESLNAGDYINLLLAPLTTGTFGHASAVRAQGNMSITRFG